MDKLDQWLSWLEGKHPTEIDLGLERIAQVADRLPLAGFRESPHGNRRTRIITVGGTNGKGSCVKALEVICSALDLSVGSYTSPHLLRFNERICVNGRPLDDGAIVEAFRQVEQSRGDISLTYFEYATLAALVIFQQRNLDVAVLEVGLGGRLDAVNIVEPDITVVTNVTLDHQAYLGNDVNSIAYEKAGIFRSNTPAICGQEDYPLMLQTRAETIGANWLCINEDFKVESLDKDLLSWTWSGRDKHNCPIAFNQLALPKVPVESVACAIQALVGLGLSLNNDLLATCMSSITLPGRFQQVQYGRTLVILDVAHNPAAAGYLASCIASLDRPAVYAITAMMGDKDIAGVLSPLVPYVTAWYLAKIKQQSRAAPCEVLMRELSVLGVDQTVIDEGKSVDCAFQSAIAEAEKNNGIVLVFGSFFTVAEVLPLL